MSWFRTDDQVPTHPKMRAVGHWGRSLWRTAGSLSSAEGWGRLSEQQVKDALYYDEIPAKHHKDAVRRLVEHRLWHDHETLRECEVCLDHYGEIEPGSFVFHEWWIPNKTAAASKDPLLAKMDNLRRRLHENPTLCAEIRQRDRDLCRYCGVLTEGWGTKDHRSPRRGEFDHVDPIRMENALDAVVVACRTCNGRKNRRTPQQAGMILWPPGTTEDDVDFWRKVARDARRAANHPTGPAPDLTGQVENPTGDPTGARENPPGPRVAREDGPGRSGNEPGGGRADLEPGRVGPGLVGPGRARPVSGLFGSGRAEPGGAGPGTPPDPDQPSSPSGPLPGAPPGSDAEQPPGQARDGGPS